MVRVLSFLSPNVLRPQASARPQALRLAAVRGEPDHVHLAAVLRARKIGDLVLAEVPLEDEGVVSVATLQGDALVFPSGDLEVNTAGPPLTVGGPREMLRASWSFSSAEPRSSPDDAPRYVR